MDRGWLYASHASHFSGVTDLRKLLLTALELANAMAYLHSVDIMHGDLTGGNVLLHSSPITVGDPRGFAVKVQPCHRSCYRAVARHGSCHTHCQSAGTTAVGRHGTCLMYF